jgi:hypothetical protein
MITAADSSCFCEAVKTYTRVYASVCITAWCLAHNINLEILKFVYSAFCATVIITDDVKSYTRKIAICTVE